MSFGNNVNFPCGWQLDISMNHGDAAKVPSLAACVSDIRKWMAANVLLLNSDKTENLSILPLILFLSLSFFLSRRT